MNINLDALRQKVQEEVNETNSRNENSNNGFPIVYPGENGQLTVRLLYNVGSNSVQRKLVRHNSGKSKVPCLQIYGEDCPVCQAINNAENLKGKECGAFSKYGYKARGICYAVIVDHGPDYFKGKDDPKKGDTVLLMYPKKVYDQINAILVNAGENLDKLLCNNEGIPVVIERSQKGGGFPDYNTYVFPFGAKKCFEDSDDKTGEELFEECINSIPNLNETIVPQYPNDEVRKSATALAQIIDQEYINNSVVNPNDENIAPTNNEEEPKVSNIGDIANNVPSIPTEQSPDSQPECFGNHQDGDKKCMLCPYEADCVLK